MVMRMFGSKKEEKKEAPVEPKIDMNNKEQVREMEKDLKRKMQKEVREIDRAVLSKDRHSIGLPLLITILIDRERHAAKAM